MSDLISEPLPYPSKLEPVPLPEGPLQLWRPLNPETVLDALVEAPADPDDKMPYWSDLWASAVGLAEAVARTEIDVSGRSVLELGCGLGLCSLVAARAGATRVRATDWDPEALRYVAASAGENGLAVETGRLDWREAPATPEADVILAADVLYEARNVRWLVRLCRRWIRGSVELWVSDPGRKWADRFAEEVAGLGLRVDRSSRTVPASAAVRRGADLTFYRVRT